MSDYSITQHIPVANHVYKFLVKRCGTDRIVATRKSFIGSLLISLHSRDMDVKKPRRNEYTRLFHIEVPFHLYEKAGVYITNYKAALFNSMVDQIFREEIFVHTIIRKHQDEELYLRTIRNLLDAYDITEEDIKLDTLYRDFKRKKEKYEANLVLK